VKDFLLELAEAIRAAVREHQQAGGQRRVLGDSPGGDAQFDIDEVAERIVWQRAQAADRTLAVYTEDGSLRLTGPDPEQLLIVDPIDGTRPTSAGLEMGTVSIAAAPFGGQPTIGDVSHALVLEIASGAWLYAAADEPAIQSSGYPWPVPRLSRNHDLDRLFWSFELNGHPMGLMQQALGRLVDRSANSGGVFVFNSASFSISRIVTGQLDAYVDIGNRLLRDYPETEQAFRRAGRGQILHLFPYDIAASVLIAKKAGVPITDGYGRSLDGMRLLDLTPLNQRSCIAAGNGELHEALLTELNWTLAEAGAA